MLIHSLEARRLLSQTILREFDGFPDSMIASGEAVYAGEWSSDGTIAGQSGQPTRTDGWYYAPFNGATLRKRSSFGSPFPTTQVSQGPQSSFYPISLAPALRESFSPPDGIVRTNDATYYDGRRAVLRSPGHSAAVMSPLIEFDNNGDTRVESIARVGSTERVCFLTGDSDGWMLWTSDGTAAGTVALKRVGDSNLQTDLVSAGEFVFFVASDSKKGAELWRTDGTLAGTTRVADLRHGSRGSDPSIVWSFYGQLLFNANDGTGQALWSTDGTEAHTRKVADVEFASSPRGVARDAVDAGGALFFAGQTAATGVEPWVTDGTPEGTRSLGDLRPGTASSLNETVMTSMNGRAYFTASSGAFRDDVWRSSGHADTTDRLTNLASSSPGGSTVIGLAAFNGAIYFSELRVGQDDRLWRLSDEKISITGFAFEDADADGARDPAESRISDMRVYIDANNNKKLDAGELSQLTDAIGGYAFAGLTPGRYVLRQEARVGRRETSPSYVLDLVAGDHAVKSFGSVQGGGVIAGRVFESAITSSGGLGGFTTFLDLNANAKRDKGEPTSTTDDTGRYAFTGLGAGIYTVRITGQAGWIAEGARGRRVRVKQNRVSDDVSFERVAGSTLVVKLFEDLNRDGKRQADEAVVSDTSATVSLAREVGFTATPYSATSTIDASGRRAFRGLPAGRYDVIVNGAWKRVEPAEPDPGNLPSPPTVPSLNSYDAELAYAETEDVLIAVERA